MRIGIAAILALLIILPSATFAEGDGGEELTADCALFFDGSVANESVQFQTSLGPRLPGSTASSELRDSIKSNLTGWDITEKHIM